MLKNRTVQHETNTGFENVQGKHAMGILDFPNAILGISPLTLEEKLTKIPGVTSIEINVFSKKITVQFDPSLTNLDKIRKILGALKN